jgi:hypothetical protein
MYDPDLSLAWQFFSRCFNSSDWPLDTKPWPCAYVDTSYWFILENDDNDDDIEGK